MESGLITPLALIRTGAAKGVTSNKLVGYVPPYLVALGADGLPLPRTWMAVIDLLRVEGIAHGPNGESGRVRLECPEPSDALMREQIHREAIAFGLSRVGDPPYGKPQNRRPFRWGQSSKASAWPWLWVSPTVRAIDNRPQLRVSDRKSLYKNASMELPPPTPPRDPMEGDNKQDLAAAQRQRILSAGKKITANDVAGLGRLWVWLGLMGGALIVTLFVAPVGLFLFFLLGLTFLIAR